MVEKLIKAVKATRNNWWEAFCLARRVRGHDYYDIPAELKYRYPAPGSCPLDEESHPHLYKTNWKVAFRDSRYNIRDKETTYDNMENTQHYI